MAAYALKTKESQPGETNTTPELRLVTEQWVGIVPTRPLTAERFYKRYAGQNVELIDGAIIERAMVQLEHENIQGWLFALLRFFVEEKNLGIVLSSRTALQITPFRVRLPDLTFVQAANAAIVTEKAIQGTPDLVVEIVSPTDRRADLLAREADYRTLGIAEIVFIYPRKRSLRLLRKEESGEYAEESRKSGQIWESSAVKGLLLEVDWIVKDPHPSLLATLARLTGKNLS